MDPQDFYSYSKAAISDLSTPTSKIGGMAVGHHLGQQFSINMGIFPMHQWSEYFTGRLMSQVQAFLCKLSEHHSIELPATNRADCD